MFSEGRVVHVMSLVTRARAELRQAIIENDEPVTTDGFGHTYALLEEAEKHARLADVPLDVNSAHVAAEFLERIEKRKEGE